MTKKQQRWQLKLVSILAVFLLLVAPTNPPAISPNASSTLHQQTSVSQPPATIPPQPIIFEPNVGQTDQQVQFLARGSGYTLFLTAQEQVMVLAQPQSSNAAKPSIPTQTAAFTPQNFSVLHFQLQGANSITPQPQQELASHSNYFIGNDPSRWHSNVPNYARVLYPNVYPGIDLTYYGSAGKLEHDFIVAAGADPKAIRLKVAGVNKLEVVAGELVLHTAIGELRQNVPHIYQEGATGRREISGGYVLMGADEVGFSLAAYDTSRPLVIDPVLDFSTYFGGGAYDEAQDITADNDGNIYITGNTHSTDFYTTTNALRTSCVVIITCDDMFVSKLNPDGTSLIYSTYIGSPYSDTGQGIAVDAAGRVYITGAGGSGLPLVNGISPDTWFLDTGRAYVAKLSATGAAILYSTYLQGGSWGSGGTRIAVDESNNAYVVGNSTNGLVVTNDAACRYWRGGGSAGDANAFIAKIDTTLLYTSSIAYASYTGAQGRSWANGVVLDDYGTMFVSGSSVASPQGDPCPFTPTSNALQLNNAGGYDAFVLGISFAGTPAIIYATFLGGSGDEGNVFGPSVGDIAISRNYYITTIYVTGQTTSNNFPTANAYQSTHAGGEDVFVTAFDMGFTSIRYSTYLGGSGNDYPTKLILDQQNRVLVTGYTGSVSGTNTIGFPTVNALQTNNAGGVYAGDDAFVAKLNINEESRDSLLFSTYFGGSSNGDRSRGIAVDRNGVAIIAGITNSANFPIANPLQATLRSGTDAFVSKINPCVPPSQDTQTGEDDYGTTWYSMDLSCTDPNAGLLSSQGNNISFDVPITITRYFGPLQEGNVATGHLRSEALDTTVLSRTELIVLGNNIVNEPITVTVANASYVLTPSIFPYYEAFALHSTQFTYIPTDQLLVPNKTEIQRDSDKNVITSTLHLPAPAVNHVTFTASQSARKNLRKVWLYMPAMRPLLLFGGSNIPYKECETRNESSFWAEFPWDTRLPRRDDPNDSIANFAVLIPRHQCITIERGGEELAVDVQAVAISYGVKKVNLLGHSAGGLWARHAATFIHNTSSYTATIDNVMMLGTPNGGSFLVDAGYGVSGESGASVVFAPCNIDLMTELLSICMKAYNNKYQAIPNTFYEDLSGRSSYKADDGAVRVSDVKALPYSSHINEQIVDNPYVLDKPVSVHEYEPISRIFRDPFANYYMMRGNHGDFAGDQYWGTGITQTAQAAVLYPSIAGNIQANQTLTSSILVDRANSATFALGWLNPTSTLKLSLRDPVGHIITPTTTYTGSSYSTCLGCDVANGVQYNISNPVTGTWQMIVQAITTTNTTEPFYTGGEFSGGVQVNPAASVSTARLGQPININATLTDTMPIRGATVTATIMLPYTGTAQVRLNEQTGGLYQGVFTPTVEGSYWVNIEAQGRNTLGQNFDRISSTMLQASSSAAISMTGFINRAYDTDGDGLSNNLVVTSTAVVSQAGKYRLSANLVAQDGRILDYRTGYFNLITGTQQVPLTFDGERIAHAAVDGPYIIRDLNFSHVLSEEISLLNLPNAYSTTAYSRYDWQRDNILKVSTVTDLGVDNNSNGLYDYLKVIVPLDTRQPGVYGASANLMSADGRLVASTYVNGLVMMTGTNTLVLRFDGPQIRASGINGSYQVKDLLLWSGSGNSDEYTSMRWVLKQTQAYTSTQFDNTPCTTSFTDVPRGYLFYDDITYLACHDIVKGYDNGNGTYRFEPNSDTKRGEFTRMLVMAFGSTAWIDPTDPTFIDVPTTHPFFSYIELLNQQGVISGFDDEEHCGSIKSFCFLPNDAALRGQVALSVRRAAGLPLYTPQNPTFSDVPITYWAYEPIESLYHLGIVTGSLCSPGSNNLCYRPNDPMLRGELSRVLFKAIQWRTNNP